jgi:prepilin-type N-terminal cleavage/methylation domain-containing protein
MCRLRFNAGFTLVELLVTIAVIAILATIAIPSFAETLIRNQTASQNNELVALIHLARNEAIKRNLQGGSIPEQTVRVELVPNGNSWEGFVRPPTDAETAEGCPLGAIRCSENQSVVLTLFADPPRPSDSIIGVTQ